MKRRMFNLLAAVSLVLLISNCALWAASFTRAHALMVSRSTWPSGDDCVFRYLSVRLVRGHWLALYGRSDTDLRQPKGIRFHHGLDVPAFRTEYAAGVKWGHLAFDVQPGPMDYFLGVQLRYGFGTKRSAPYTYRGKTEASQYFVVPAWATVLALALLPGLWVARAARGWRRPRTGLCLHCGYDLTGNVSGVCPECGTVIRERSAIHL